MVTDTGEGIAADRIKAIFERGRSTRIYRTGGLGLHWCANALKAQGGAIAAQSDGPGKGATILITLPCPACELKDVA
jgi:signal transduction histidine kinase